MTRRQFCPRPIVRAVFVAIVWLCSLQAKVIADDPLNVVFILVDDLGWSDIGVNGSTFYQTHCLDRIAKEGANFTNAYSASPICSPSMVSILTRKYPRRINLSYITRTTGSKGRGYKLLVMHPGRFIPYHETSIAEVLGANNYKTVNIGKWH